MKRKKLQMSLKNVEPQKKVRLGFLFWNFLKIGTVSFGGFMALISVIEDVIVHQHKLMKHEDMLDGISLANLLPGPQAVNVVAFVGYRLRNGMGALISATAVLLPTFILMVLLTYAYFTYGNKPAITDFLKGFTPAVTAIIISVA